MHVHTCLSPCGELDMHPSAIARAAVEAGLDGIVICDHNAADNVAAVGRAARAAGCVAVPGMEITTEEEVHLVALLPDAAAAGVLHARVAAALPGRNAPAAFGEQVIANEHGEVLGFNDVAAGRRDVVDGRAGPSDEIHRAGGLAIAAHVDRERFGIVGQLGFVPAGLAARRHRGVGGHGLRRRPAPLRGPARAAGRHRLGRARTRAPIGRALTFLHLDRAETAEVRRAIRAEGGRAVLGGGRPMEDLALHILDIAQQRRRGRRHAHRRSGSTRTRTADALRIVVTRQRPRHGCRARRRARRTRSSPPAGRAWSASGLPLLRQAAEAAGGGLRVASEPGAGTRVEAVFGLGHLDRAPLGDVETTVLVLMASHPDVDLDWTHRRGPREYSLATADLRAALDGASLASPAGLALLRSAVRHGELSLADAAGSRSRMENQP